MSRVGWCVHYTGLVGPIGEPKPRRCKAGIAYDDVLGSPGPHGYALPCLGKGDPSVNCARYERVTADMEAASLRQAVERLEQYVGVLKSGHCPHCGGVLTGQCKIGRCTYSAPCGHRLNEIPAVIRGLEFIT